MKIHCIIILLIVSTPLVTYAQSSYEYGILPSVNVNKKLPYDWSVNFKSESRQSLIKEEFNYDYLFTDLSIAVAKKTGVNTTIAIGYLIRVNEEFIVNRAIQQISFIQRGLNFRLAHRVTTDQTFHANNDTEFRFRYRLSTEIPLNGQSLDIKEFFLKINNEYLNSLQGKSYDLEIRGAGFIGYVVSPKNKIELGLDYRIDSFLSNYPRNRFWIGLNFYLSI